MISTATPRSQSRYARLLTVVSFSTRSSGHRRNVERRRQLDVLAERMPDRAVLVTRQSDRSLDRGRRHVTPNVEMQLCADDTCRRLLGPLGDDMGAEPT